jgi:hypothetical protein
MGCNASSEQRPTVSPLLTPATASCFGVAPKLCCCYEQELDYPLKQLWLRESTAEFPFNEYRLDGIPESLNTFVDEFLKEDGTYDYDRLIWTSKKSFVRVGEYRRRVDGNRYRARLPMTYRNYRFGLRLTSGSRCLPLYIHSTTLEDAMACLEFLVGLHDDHFEKMELCYFDEFSQLCPLTSVILEKMLQQNAKRKHVLSDMVFTPDQCRPLATSGTRTDIELYRCRFHDDGAAFLEALVERGDPQTGLAKLSVAGGLPFAEGILILFVHMLECLRLNRIDLESEEACCAVAAAELQSLNLAYCGLGDGGASLVESMKEGRGPKELLLVKSTGVNDWRLFDSPERFISFLDALRGNSHLERLVLPCFDLRERGIRDALAAAFFENKGLVHLELPYCRLNKSRFCDIFRAISTHPSLRTLDLACRDIINMDKTAATKAVAEMLSVNKQLERIRIKDCFRSSFDSSAWAALVTPRLECNVHRKRFPGIQEITPLSTRAAVLASALAHVRNKPWLVCMLLRENADIISSYLVDK